MGTTFRFLAVEGEGDAALDWFHRQPDPPEVIDKAGGQLLYFRATGALVRTADGAAIDVGRSPLVSLIRPVRKRGVLWTAGEVHFLPTGLRRTYPPLYALSQRFKEWLSGFDVVFTSEPSWPGEWNYYLEGGIRNQAERLFALPLAMQALRAGQYFVAAGDGDGVLDTVCRSLRLRGVECTSETASRATTGRNNLNG
jgi:hypothetical protein